jgi:hypothetical protein
VAGGVDVTAALSAARGYRVEFRQVMFCPAATADEVARNPLVCAPPPDTTLAVAAPRVSVTPAPSRGDVLDALAAACRYPRVLLEGDPAATRAMLEVRAARGRRLVTTFGMLYGRRSRGVAGDDG